VVVILTTSQKGSPTGDLLNKIRTDQSGGVLLQ